MILEQLKMRMDTHHNTGKILTKIFIYFFIFVWDQYYNIKHKCYLLKTFQQSLPFAQLNESTFHSTGFQL